ncbi:N-acetyltransferase [Actinomadura rubrobrunea]|uniref:N-acetyltransferase n=1 Tax=Actinomadura rubrobrunea TaxID=115335 RepID=A0A9W6PYP9_9ACTN|nr:GNAT family N-acetyltransferase [Actinomadura rubrobrunea]GLW65318.1 N-acetyltransferase [Actinomadura rubrobrunea]
MRTKVRPRDSADRAAVEAFLARNHSARVARRGELLYPLDHPAFVADADDGRLLGVLTYVPDEARKHCEILTLHTAEQWRGVGTALIETVEQWASSQGHTRLWLITTNDNVDALRFYQRRDFHIAAVLPRAVTDSRTRLKPEIPLTGNYGIPIRDEIELEKRLG